MPKSRTAITKTSLSSQPPSATRTSLLERRQRRRQCQHQLYSQQSDDNNEEKENDNNSIIQSKHEEQQQSSSTIEDLKSNGVISDFLYGIQYVNSQYLALLWKYSIVQSFAVTIPFAIILWTTYMMSSPSSTVYSTVYNVLYYPLYYIWSISSSVASILQLPLDCMKYIVESFPTILITLVEYLPNYIAVHIVQTILSVQDMISSITFSANRNFIISFVSSMFTLVVWRPAVEEWEYRSILNKLLFAPRIIQQQMTQRFSYQQQQQLQQWYNPYHYRHQQRRQMMMTMIPLYKSKMMITINQLSSSSSSSNPTTTSRGIMSRIPPVNESNRILLGSILFATTRLGWLSTDPVSSDFSSSPYSWTIGFLQSILSHFSSQVLSEVRPTLRIWLLLLAIHQCVSTFLVAQYVFATVYREKGLAASVGSHIAWTVGKGTIPFRIIWRFYGWCTNNSIIPVKAKGKQVKRKQCIGSPRSE